MATSIRSHCKATRTKAASSYWPAIAGKSQTLIGPNVQFGLSPPVIKVKLVGLAQVGLCLLSFVRLSKEFCVRQMRAYSCQSAVRRNSRHCAMDYLYFIQRPRPSSTWWMATHDGGHLRGGGRIGYSGTSCVNLAAVYGSTISTLKKKAPCRYRNCGNECKH